MHGVVPKVLWQRVHPADADNRIRLVCRTALVDEPTSGARTLIDLGAGQRWSSKDRRHHALEEGPDVPDVLREAGVDPDSISHVVLTHLHWDHAGGLLTRQGDLAFPNAEHVVGDACLRRALAPSPREGASFRADLAEALTTTKLRRWRPGEPLAPGLEGRLFGGHTEGLIVPLARHCDNAPPLAFPTDLVPTRSHLKPTWIMAFDVEPLRIVAEKQALFDELGRLAGGLCFYHDPDVEVALTETVNGSVTLRAGPFPLLTSPVMPP